MIILDLYFRSFLRQSRLIMSGHFVENLQSVQKCTQIKTSGFKSNLDKNEIDRRRARRERDGRLYIHLYHQTV